MHYPALMVVVSARTNKSYHHHYLLFLEEQIKHHHHWRRRVGRIEHNHDRCLLTLVLVYFAHWMGYV